MKIKYKDILRLNAALDAVGNLPGVKFALIVNKNKKLMEGDLEALKKASDPSEEHKEYSKAKEKLNKGYAAKDDNGTPKTMNVNGVLQYVIPNQKKWRLRMEELKLEHVEARDARTKQEEDFQKLLDETTDIKFFKLKEEEIPEKITPNQLNLIKEIVDM